MSIPTWDEAAEDMFWENLPRELHEGAVHHYLGAYGDAIEARVRVLEQLAEGLLKSNFLGPSLAVSVTALEVMIHYFCVRPIVRGAMLSDLLAEEVSKWILRSRSSELRRLLVAVLRPWGIDLEKLLLPDGSPLWQKIQSVVIERRDEFLHRGDPPSEEEASLAIHCLRSFRSDVVYQIAAKFGFTLQKTGRWSHIVRDKGETHFGTADPFAKTKT